jgi:lantibiotic transport system permease protein
MLWIASLASLSWKYSYFIPYTYTMFYFLHGETGSGRRAITPPVNIHVMAAGYFILLTAISYILYITKKEKG